MADSVRILIKVQPGDIIYIDKTLESIGHLARLTVVHGKEGLFEVVVTHSLKEQFMEFINHSTKEYQIISEQEITD